MIEAGVAHFLATGKTSLLEIVKKLADLFKRILQKLGKTICFVNWTKKKKTATSFYDINHVAVLLLYLYIPFI